MVLQCACAELWSLLLCIAVVLRRKHSSGSVPYSAHLNSVCSRGARFNRLRRLIDCLPRIDSQSRGEKCPSQFRM